MTAHAPKTSQKLITNFIDFVTEKSKNKPKPNNIKQSKSTMAITDMYIFLLMFFIAFLFLTILNYFLNQSYNANALNICTFKAFRWVFGIY